VLAATAGGARRLLQARGQLSPGLVLTCPVATSIRGPADEQATGNRAGIMLVLPIFADGLSEALGAAGDRGRAAAAPGNAWLYPDHRAVTGAGRPAAE